MKLSEEKHKKKYKKIHKNSICFNVFLFNDSNSAEVHLFLENEKDFKNACKLIQK